MFVGQAMNFRDRLLVPIERLTAALCDPRKRERTVVALLAVYVVVWTLYGVLAKGSQDIHFDMAEAAAWSRELALGNAKHPPLSGWLAGAWFTVFPSADWAYYLLAITLPALALWIAWRLSADYLDAEKRVIGLVLLTLIPFFNFHALKYNANTVLMPLWAATTLFFLRSLQTRALGAAALAGVLAALSMLGKYWSIMLIAGLGIAALAHAGRRAYFRSPAPWVTILAGASVLAPHVAWLIKHDFLPFAYAAGIHAGNPYLTVVEKAAGYVGGAIAFVAVPVALALLAARPGRAALADILWPAQPDRRLAALAFWGPLLLPIPVALLTRTEIIPLWTMGAWTLLLVMLLSSPYIKFNRRDAARFVAIAVLFPLVMLAAAPAIGIVIHKNGVKPSSAHARLLAEKVQQVWRAGTDRPLRFVGGDTDLAYGVAFYLPSRPSAATSMDASTASTDREARIARDGIALVCPAERRDCLADIARQAARGPTRQRVEVEIVRDHFGIPGAPARYVIVTISPRL